VEENRAVGSRRGDPGEDRPIGPDLPGQYFPFRRLSFDQIRDVVRTPSAGYTSAFYGDAELKQRFVERAKMHRAADEIVRGTYWSTKYGESGERAGFQGCAVGCLSHASEEAHRVLSRLTNVPQAIYQLTDYLFENRNLDGHKDLPLAVMEAIPVGSDQSHTHYRILARLLENSYMLAGGEARRNKVIALLRDPAIDPKEKLEAVNKIARVYSWTTIDTFFWSYFAGLNTASTMRDILLEELAAAPVPTVETANDDQLTMAEFMKDFVTVEESVEVLAS